LKPKKIAFNLHSILGNQDSKKADVAQLARAADL